MAKFHYRYPTVSAHIRYCQTVILFINVALQNTWVGYVTIFIIYIIGLFAAVCITSRSWWPRGIRHELFSPAQTLGSWVRILLKAWMSVCVYSVCVGSGLATG
jgi:hypothetical protein